MNRGAKIIITILEAILSFCLRLNLLLFYDNKVKMAVVSPQGYAEPSPLRSCHLYTKDAQCAETKDVTEKIISHHIAFLSYWRPKKVQKVAQRITFFSKVAKFAEKIRIDLTIFFSMNDFLVRFLVFEI